MPPRVVSLAALKQSAERIAFDFVVLGAGGGGCAGAAALCRKYPDAKVALVEAGDGSWNTALGHQVLKAPALVPLARRLVESGNTTLPAMRNLTWAYKTTEESSLDGRSLTLRRGKGLGGNSIINDAVYLRGSRSDFESWSDSTKITAPTEVAAVAPPGTPAAPEAAAPEAVAAAADATAALSGGDPKVAELWSPDAISKAYGALRTSKALWVERGSLNSLNTPLNAAFVNVCEAMDLNPVESLNVDNSHPQTAALEHLTYKGQRLDAYTMHCDDSHPRFDATSKPAPLNNLTVITRAFALAAHFEKNSTTGRPVASAVRLVSAEDMEAGRGGSSPVVKVDCGKGLVVSLGAIESPLFLQRSGVGDPAHLRSIQLEAVASNPEVGRNVRAQPQMYFTASYSRQARSKSLYWENARYMYEQWAEFKRSGRGVFGSSVEWGALIHSQRNLANADVRVEFMSNLVDHMTGGLLYGLGYGLRLTMARGDLAAPSGTISAASADPTRAPPVVDLNLFKTDRLAFEEAVAWGQMMLHPSLGIISERAENPQGYTHPFEYYLVTMKHPAMPALDAADRRKLVQKATTVDGGSVVGSCALGKAVEADLSLRGVDGVWVADSSVIPTKMNADPSVVAQMVGSRVAEFIALK